MYILEEGIPIPPKMGLARYSKYPFKGMKVGSSFFVPAGPEESTESTYHRVMTAANNFTQRFEYRWKFTTRRCVESDVSGVRIWRIE